jgi:hypothetical protein
VLSRSPEAITAPLISLRSTVVPAGTAIEMSAR